jgi:HD-like signal output (HDOD) protein
MSVINQVFESGQHLPILPKVVHEVMLALDEDSPDLKKIVDKINHDPVIAAKVLKLANSAHYGVSRQIKTIEDAIALIGFSKLATLVIASIVTDSMTKVPNIDMRQFWIRSLVTASVARALASQLHQSTEVAYLGGLMHGIGQLIIHLFFPTAGIVIEKACMASNGLERNHIENTHLGVDHCQIGQELTKRWCFPTEIQQVVRYYAEPMHPQAGDLSPLVHLAVHIAYGLVNEDSVDRIIQSMPSDVAKPLSLDASQWVNKVESYKAFIPEAEAFI